MQELAFHVSYCVCFLLSTVSLIAVPAKVISSLRSPEDEPACPLVSQTQVLSRYHCFPYKTDPGLFLEGSGVLWADVLGWASG